MAGATRAVLGIDAAWTDKNPSGVALAVELNGQWCLIRAEASAAEFVMAAGATATVQLQTQTGLDAAALLSAAEQFCGIAPDIIAIDMPLSRKIIASRRSADDAVSRKYGGRKCGTHSPNSSRPGKVGERMQRAFENAGYELCVTEIRTPGLIEVYPHPALLEMIGAEERLKYKVGKRWSYWPHDDPPSRRAKLMDVWAGIGAALERQIAGTEERLGEAFGFSVRELKAREDLIDAIVCCAVAVCALEGNAMPHGDNDAAIWIPAGKLQTAVATS